MSESVNHFVNHYECDRCGRKWTDIWSAMCDDDCPSCGARHISPYRSDDADIVEFANHYKCYRCDHTWTGVWLSICEDDCPSCGAQHVSPYRSDDAGFAASKKKLGRRKSANLVKDRKSPPPSQA